MLKRFRFLFTANRVHPHTGKFLRHNVYYDCGNVPTIVPASYYSAETTKSPAQVIIVIHCY